MFNTENIDLTEIQKKAAELFDLLEAAAEEHGDDDLAYAMRDKMGDFLKNSRGHFLLKYGHELSLTESEQAAKPLDEAAHWMNDEALSTITEVSEVALKLVELWNTPKEERKENHAYRFSLRMKHLKEAATKIREATSSVWRWRAKSYREEIEKQKEAISQ